MRPRSRLRWVLAALMTAPAVAVAQQVRGVIRDSASTSPLPGAVVIVLDSAGAPGNRTITDAQGRFTVSAPAAARLRLMRIGYRLRDVSLGATPGPLDLTMSRVPPVLDRVRIVDSELCPGSTDRGTAFQLWEQARAGLLATIVARELKPATAKTMVYESGLSPTDEVVRRQVKSIRSGRTSRPFLSAAGPSYFAQYGYLAEDGASRVFSAPDADILLHESFAATHCFQLRRADASHPGQTGLAFAPIRGRDTLVDVSGVIWIDDAVPQVRSVDFAYQSLEPAAMTIKPGGNIVFRTMPNGVAFIERWSLRLPNLQIVPRPRPRPGSGPSRAEAVVSHRRDRTDLRVAEIQEAGGFVLEAQWTDGTSWTDTPALITGLATRRKSNSPVADALVTLDGTNDTTTTDSAGEFELPAIPGKYHLMVVDTSLGALVKPRSESQSVVAVHAAVSTVRVELQSVGDVVADVCRGQPMHDNAAIIIGVAVMANATNLAGARVVATGQSDFSSSAGGGLSVRSFDQEIDVDDGRFVVCGVTRDRLTRMRLMKGSTRLGDTTVRVPLAGVVHKLIWRIGLSTGDSMRVSAESNLSRPSPLPRPASLDTTRVGEGALSTRLRTFEAHRASRQGTYVSDSALRMRFGHPLSEVLVAAIHDLRVWRTRDGVFVVPPVAGRVLSGFRNGSRCFSTIWIDGELRWEDTHRETVQPFSIGHLRADDFVGVEHYGPNAPLPAEYRGASNTCGTLVLWSR